MPNLKQRKRAAVLRAPCGIMCSYLGLANGSWSYCTSSYPSPVPSNQLISAATQPGWGRRRASFFFGGPHGQEVVRRQPELGCDGFQFAPDVRAAWYGAIGKGQSWTATPAGRRG